MTAFSPHPAGSPVEHAPGATSIAPTPAVHHWCDLATGSLIYCTLIFAPWAFGTTEPGSVQVMNAAGLALGLLWVAKLGVRRITGWQPTHPSGRNRRVVNLAGLLTWLVLAWCLVGALNTRGRFVPETGALELSESYLPWLPHSYDGPSTWATFWQVLALASVFWSLRDWLLAGAGDSPPRGDHEVRDGRRPQSCSSAIPHRLRGLLWVLCLSGGLLTLQGILQRLTGSSSLLWWWQPTPDAAVETAFGPFAYRGNAAQYLNLLWPICLALGLCVHHRAVWGRKRGFGSAAGVFLILAAACMAVTVLALGTRAGAVVCLGLLLAAGVVAAAFLRRLHGGHAWLLVMLGLVALALGWSLSGNLAVERLLRPAYAYATGLVNPLPEYTLRCVFEVPSTNLSRSAGLVGLGPSDSFAYAPGSVFVTLQPNGELGAEIRDPQRRGGVRLNLSGFVKAHAGQVVNFVLVKDREVKAYANGRLLAVSTNLQPFTTVAGWKKDDALTAVLRQPQPADFLWAGSQVHVRAPGRQWVQRCELYDRALSTEEIAVLAADAPAEALTPGSALDPAPGLQPVRTVTRDDLRRPGFLNPYSSGRVEIDRVSRRMIAEYGWLGSGPGTYGTLYGLHAGGTAVARPAHAHNDWLEFRITWGWPGMLLLVVAFLCVPMAALAARAWWREPLIVLAFLALAGCLAHAWVDYPFQVYSVVHLFVVLCCLVFVLGSQGRTVTPIPAAALSA